MTAEKGEARLWLPRSDDANDAANRWRDSVHARTLEEQNRLLYVAMTRAEDRLYIGGWIGTKGQDAECWYERIRTGLQASSGEAGSPREDSAHMRATARDFDFATPELLGSEGWSGDGFELVGEGTTPVSEQAELPIPTEAKLPVWWQSPRQPNPIRRRRWHRRSRCPTKARTNPRLSVR